jgi:hypothetical protein
MRNSRMQALNDGGRLIGEDHPMAKLTNKHILELCFLRDTDPEQWTYSKLAARFAITKSYARQVCCGLKRCQIPDHYRRKPCDTLK